MAKAQASVEYLTLVIVFLTVAIPLILLFMSQSSIRGEALKQEQVNTALFLLKQRIELVFSQCPSSTVFTVSLPDTAERTTLIKEGDNVFIKFEGRGFSRAVKLDVLKKDAELEASGEVEGSGLQNIEVSCKKSTVDRDSKQLELYELSISSLGGG